MFCLALGYKHPDHIDLSPLQLSEWLWYYKTHGMGADRADDRAFAVLAVLGGEANLKSTRWPFFDRQLTPEELADRFNALVDMRNQANAEQS